MVTTFKTYTPHAFSLVATVTCSLVVQWFQLDKDVKMPWADAVSSYTLHKLGIDDCILKMWDIEIVNLIDHAA